MYIIGPGVYMPVSNGVLRCHGPEALGQILWSLRRPRYYNRFSFFFSPLFIFLGYCGVKALKLLVKYSGAFAAPRFPFFVFKRVPAPGALAQGLRGLRRPRYYY